MATLLRPPSVGRPHNFILDSGMPEPDVLSEEGKKVRDAVRIARRYLPGRTVLPLSEELPVTAVARQTLRAVLERYRRPEGYEGYLVEAAWQLEQLGPDAWPVLRDLLLAGAQEGEYFLGAAVRLEDVAPQDRLTGLLAAACNPDANVRSRLLELLEEMPGEVREEVLRELAAESRPDDSVTDRAREAAHEQAS
jgi:hypothetical protein